MGKKLRIYLSHPIRGVKGVIATTEDMENNNKKAINKATEIRIGLGSLGLDNYIDTYIYVPAEHDEFIIIGYQKGILSEKDILEIDCDIVARCDLMLIYDWEHHFSKGCKVEFDYAKKHHIPVYTFDDDTNVVELVNFIHKVKE